MYIGDSVGVQMSNKWEIEKMLTSNDWIVSKFTACEDDEELLNGLQLFLKSESLRSEITLIQLGNINDGDCRTLKLSGELTSVEASYDSFMGRVTEIIFIKGPTKASFGTS